MALPNDFYRRTIDSLTEYAVLTLDLSGLVTSWSEGARRVLGWSEAEMIGKNPAVIFIEEDRERGDPEKEIGTALEKGKALDERWHRRKDGSRFWGSGLMFPLTDGEDRRIGLVKVVRDRTEKRKQDQAVRADFAELELLIDNVPSLISYVDQGERYVFTNKAYAMVFGRTKEEMRGKGVREFLGPEIYATVQPRIAKVLRGVEQDFELEFPQHRDRGSWRWVRVSYVPHFKGDRIPGFISLASDVTRLKQTENELNTLLERREARVGQLGRSLDAVMYAASHDLRAPLRKIEGFAELIAGKEKERLSAEGRERFMKVARACREMRNAIEVLEDMTHLGQRALRFEKVDLSGLARETLERLKAADPQRQVAWRVAPGLTVTADPVLVEVVVRQLLDNAWKFSSKKPRAEIELSSEDCPTGRCFAVRDTGRGFDPVHAQRIFEPFQRLEHDDLPGRGVGLAIASRAVDRMGGRISGEGRPGEGATFRFSIDESRAS